MPYAVCHMPQKILGPKSDLKCESSKVLGPVAEFENVAICHMPWVVRLMPYATKFIEFKKGPEVEFSNVFAQQLVLRMLPYAICHKMYLVKKITSER